MRFALIGCANIATESVDESFKFEAEKVTYKNKVRVADSFNMRPTKFSQVQVVGELSKTMAFGWANVGLATSHHLPRRRSC